MITADVRPRDTGNPPWSWNLAGLVLLRHRLTRLVIPDL